MLGSIPLSLLLLRTMAPNTHIAFQPGYLAASLAPRDLLEFWIFNLGFHLILFPIGMYYAPKRGRIMILPTLIILLIPNVFRLSPDMINNHKLINFAFIFIVMFSAQTIITIVDQLLRSRTLKVIVYAIFLVTLTLSGILDIFPVINDHKIAVTDIQTNPDAKFFASVPQDSVIMNSTWLYHPANIAGRAIYSGYSYFTWSYGYDKDTREKSQIALYQARSLDTVCRIAKDQHISYIEVSSHAEQFIHPNFALWDTLTPIYTNPVSTLKVFDPNSLCQKNIY